MKVIGYIRVSTDQQDLKKQKRFLLQYAQQHQLFISEFIGSEAIFAQILISRQRQSYMCL